MHFEREVGFDRDTFDLAAAAAVEREKLKEKGTGELSMPIKASVKENKHLMEYPFAEFVQYSDYKLSTDRLRSPEE